MTVEDVVIGLMGAGILGMLGFFMTSFKSDLRDLGERMGRIETILTKVVEQVAVIATTQGVHGRILEEHSRKLDEHGRKLDEHGRILTDHRRILGEHTRILAEHSRILATHGRKLDEHSRILEEHSRTLADHGRMLAQVLDYGERIAALEAAPGAA